MMAGIERIQATTQKINTFRMVSFQRFIARGLVLMKCNERLRLKMLFFREKKEKHSRTDGQVLACPFASLTKEEDRPLSRVPDPAKKRYFSSGSGHATEPAHNFGSNEPENRANDIDRKNDLYDGEHCGLLGWWFAEQSILLHMKQYFAKYCLV
jgi:hypothetical protein